MFFSSLRREGRFAWPELSRLKDFWEVRKPERKSKQGLFRPGAVGCLAMLLFVSE
jgi:hypothetical protein